MGSYCYLENIEIVERANLKHSKKWILLLQSIFYIMSVYFDFVMILILVRGKFGVSFTLYTSAPPFVFLFCLLRGSNITLHGKDGDESARI
jgi:hypothetical protein